MSKFKNIGIAEAGVVPDLSSVFSSMVSGFQNISAQQQQSSNKLLDMFARKRAKSKQLAGLIENKANRVTASTDDADLDRIIAVKAYQINNPIMNPDTRLREPIGFNIKQEDVDKALKDLDVLDVMKNDIYKIRQTLVDFKKTASFENMSDEAMESFQLLLDNNFEIGDIKNRTISFLGSNAYEINIDDLKNMYVARDDKGIRNAQIIINQHVNPSKKFSSIGFNQDFNSLMQGKNHFGALLMVNELESGPKGTIKDQLVNNLPEFVSALNSLNSDLDGDGTKDSEQITQENAIEFIDILTKPGNKNYDEQTTNVFVKTVLENQTSKTNLANKTALLLSQENFNIDEFFRTSGTTGNVLGNVSKVMQNLSKGDIRTAKDFAMNLGFIIEKVDGNEYQLFKAKADLRETIGKGKNEQPNPNYRTYQPADPVGKKFDVSKQESIVELFQQMLRGAGVNGFNAESLYTFEKYLEANPGYLTPGPDVDLQYSDPK